MDRIGMSSSEQQRDISQQILSSKREVTLLFTDIKASTAYWHKHGDLQGRLMLDRHNRLLFPLVKRFHGRLIKTIGDSIMALFKEPDDALKAAIAMQQVLRKEREQEEAFDIEIRIGIHTGEAIVERHDVYGDVVNIASRIEEQADAGEITLSSYTRKLLRGELCRFKKGESFIPKGKKRKMALFVCQWETLEELCGDRSSQQEMRLSFRQKMEMLLYIFFLSLFAYFIYERYLRYLLVDNESLSLVMLYPSLIWREYGYLLLLLLLFPLWLLYRLFRGRSRSVILFRTLKGGSVFGLLFLLLYMTIPKVPTAYLPQGEKVYWQSEHLIVKVLHDSTALYRGPSHHSKVLFYVDKGRLLLLSEVQKHGGITWNRVRIGQKSYAWIERVIPPQMGIARKRVSRTNLFVIHEWEVYVLIISLLGFLWGYRRLYIRPL